MEIGLIGLGKMGYNLALNMLSKGHQLHVFDPDTSKIGELESRGARPASSIAELTFGMTSPRVIWLMVPAGEAVDRCIESLKKSLKEGDIIIDGGNSFFKDSIAHWKELNDKGIHFLDCGSSGGVEGAKEGLCLMVGGEKEVVAGVEPLFKDISVPSGYMHVGPPGSGHFVKMVHNGIEYGMMQAIAEGFTVLQKYDNGFDLSAIAHLWNHGSVIRSWLIELTSNLYREHDMDSVAGRVGASGEGEWTAQTASELGVEVPVIESSVAFRKQSQEKESYSAKVLALLRNQFGGHHFEEK